MRARLDKERSFAWLRTQTGRRGGDQTQHALAPFQQTVRGNTFAPLFLIHALIFSFHLRSTKKTANMKKWGHETNALNVVMARALRCFPPEVASLAQLVVQKMVLPSAATMTRARFYLDVAWMLQMSQFHSRLISEGACLYGMLDSSPQGGRNWLMTEYSGIHGGSLIEAAGSAHSMALLALAGAEEEDEARGISWNMRKHARLVRDSCFAHILPPAGLGARHASAAHKAHAWLHHHRLESKDWSST